MIRRWLPYVAIMASTIAMVIAVVVYVRLDAAVRDARRQQQAFAAESLRARDANCLQFERDHLRDVVDLRNTYKFLSDPKQRALAGPGLVKLVFLGLSKTEAKARHDTAPGYCDKPGLGRPEPDPVVPCRPRVIVAPGPKCPPKQ